MPCREYQAEAFLVIVLHMEQGPHAEKLAVEGVGVFSEAHPTLLGARASAPILSMRSLVNYEDAKLQLLDLVADYARGNAVWKSIHELVLESERQRERQW